MTELDDVLVPDVLDLIDDLGVNMTFQAATKTYNPATGKTTESSTVNHTWKASPPLEYSDRYIDGDFIRVNDCRIFVADSGITFTPEKGMKVTMADSTAYDIIRVKRHDSGALTCAWELQLRR